MTSTTSSSIGLSWTARPFRRPNCTVSSYTIYGGTTTNPTTVVASGVTGPSYTATGLAASTTHYYKVAAVDAFGTAPASAQVSDTTSSNGTRDFIAIDCAGPGASNASGGDATFIADVDFSGGGTNQKNY